MKTSDPENGNEPVIEPPGEPVVELPGEPVVEPPGEPVTDLPGEPIEAPGEPITPPSGEPVIEPPGEPMTQPPGEQIAEPATASATAMATATERRPAAPPDPPSPPAPRSEAASPAGRRPSRPSLAVERAPVSREHAGYAFRLDPMDLARLRELPGSRGKTDEELGKEFLESYGDRLVAAVADDLPPPATVRVLVDPYSRQVFLAVEDRVRGILSF